MGTTLKHAAKVKGSKTPPGKKGPPASANGTPNKPTRADGKSARPRVATAAARDEQARREAEENAKAKPEQVTPDYNQLFRDLVRRANEGERSAINRLRRVLDLDPNIWRRAGDLTIISERAWTELIAGVDQFRTEAVRRQVAELKEQLKGPHPTRLEALLADQIAITWLATQHAEIQAASQAGSSLDQANFKLKRAESSQKRFLAAMKMLATLRAVAPQGLAPLHRLRLFDEQKKQA